MLPIDTLLTFAVAALLLSISPGPSNLYIMARSIAQGYQAGIAAAAGMALGTLIYIVATALGIAAIFNYSPMAYTLVKLFGAAYLVYLGISYIRASFQGIAEKPHVRTMTIARVFRQSIVVELTNPKTALFFLAFLPQFTQPEEGNLILQLTLLGLVYAVIAFCSDLTVVCLSGKLGKWLSGHPAFVVWQDRIAGSMLIGLGTYLAAEERLTENP